jgi:ubiquinone biosynthesis monooxygenase Coq7
MRSSSCRREVCAQALYFGQAFVARDETTRGTADAAAETDHLAWCGQRLRELDSRWFSQSDLGMAAQPSAPLQVWLAIRSAWKLKLRVETERQVEAHLDGHLQKLLS